jgi:hypothetical protein
VEEKSEVTKVINRDQRDGHDEAVVLAKNDEPVVDDGLIHSCVVSDLIRRKTLAGGFGQFLIASSSALIS